MAEETTPKDITPMKRKGIGMAVSALKKTFPFITGYQDDVTTQYDSIHYIDLNVDLKKLSEYMGKEINPYWETLVKEDPKNRKVYAIWSYLRFPDELYSRDVSNHPGYLLGKEIGDLLDTIYEFLPEEYKLYYEHMSEYTTNPLIIRVRLMVNGYIMT
jgi:hypothetical protein